MKDTNVKAKLVEMLGKLDTLMVATTGDGGMFHARPMAVADVETDGIVWFVTAKESPKVSEISTDDRAMVTGQNDRLFVSVSGRLRTVDDRARLRELWKDTWKVWFPNGKDDPSITLMRFSPEIGEYWDNRGTKGLRYVFEAAKALVDGRRPGEVGPDQHAKVGM